MLNNSETTVRNLVESKDEEQIMKAELEKQMNYKMAKYCSTMANIVGVVVWCILHIAGIKGKGFVILWGGIIVILLIIRFWEWLSCKKHSGEIWDRKKIREIAQEMGKENRRG